MATMCATMLSIRSIAFRRLPVVGSVRFQAEVLSHPAQHRMTTVREIAGRAVP